MTSTSESGFSASCQGSDKDEQSHRVLPAEMPDRGPCAPETRPGLRHPAGCGLPPQPPASSPQGKESQTPMCSMAGNVQMPQTNEDL